MATVEEFTREDRLFVLDTEGDPDGYFKFLTGVRADGHQVLSYYGGEGGPAPPECVEVQDVWFDTDGHLLESVEVRIPRDPASTRPDEYVLDEMCRVRREYLQAQGVKFGPIRVRHFRLKDPFPIRVNMLPSWLPEQIWDPYSLLGATSLKEAIDIVNIAVEGIRFGDFRLFWDNESFGIWGDQYPHDHPARQELPGNPLQLVPDRVYVLKTHGSENAPPYFHAGMLPDGRQGLMGLYHDDVECLLFDPAGQLLEPHSRSVGAWASGEFNWERQLAIAQPIIAAWQKELGWQDQPIRVRFFMHPTRQLFVSDLRGEKGVLDYYDPFQYGPENREQVRAAVRAWLAAGNYVLQWSQSFPINPQGEVISA